MKSVDQLYPLGLNLAVIDDKGKLTAFKYQNHQNESFYEVWHKKLPNFGEKSETDYYTFFNRGILYIIYSFGKRDITMIDVKNPDNCHRVLKQSKMPLAEGIENLRHGKTLMVGVFFLVFGGDSLSASTG